MNSTQQTPAAKYALNGTYYSFSGLGGSLGWSSDWGSVSAPLFRSQGMGRGTWADSRYFPTAEFFRQASPVADADFRALADAAEQARIDRQRAERDIARAAAAAI